MLKNLNITKWFTGLVGVLGIFLILIIGGILTDWYISDDKILHIIADTVQEDFSDDIRDARDRIARVDAGFYKKKSEISILRYSWEGKLREWSSTRYIPDSATAKNLIHKTSGELLSDKGSLHYVGKFQTRNDIFLYLIPLKIHYPIQNNYLKDYVYLGRLNRFFFLQNRIEDFDIQQKELESSDGETPNTTSSDSLFASGINQNKYVGEFNIKDDLGGTYFKVIIKDISIFREPFRIILSGFCFIAIILAGIAFYLLLKIKISHNLVRWVLFTAAIFSVRYIIFAFNLPNSYVQLDFFSSRTLAINDFTASLGDLTLNTIIFYTGVWSLISALPVAGTIQAPGGFIGKGIWLVSLLALIGFCFGAILFYVAFYSEVISNSQIYYELTDYSEINFFSFLLYANLLWLLMGLFLIGRYLGQWFAYFQSKFRVKDSILGFGVAGLLAILAYLVPTDQTLVLLSGILFFGTVTATGFLLPSGNKLNFWASSLVVGCFVLLTGATIAHYHENQVPIQMEQTLSKLTSQRDLITEYEFDKTFQTIQQDQLNLVSGKNTSEIRIEDIIQKYFLPKFRDYVVDIEPLISKDAFPDFIDTTFKSKNTTIQDEQLSKNIFVDIKEVFLKKNYRKAESFNQQLKPTLSKYFRFLPSRHPFSGVYLGFFPISRQVNNRYETRYFYVSLTPKNISDGHFYPELLLDQKIKERQSLPRGMEVAFYYQNNFSRRLSENSNFSRDFSRDFHDEFHFPLTLEGREESLVSDNVIQSVTRTRLGFESLRKISDDVTAFIFIRKFSTFDYISCLSTLFYIFIIQELIRRLIIFRGNLKFSQLRPFMSGIVFRLQFFLGVITFVPLLIIGLFTTGIFEDFFYGEATYKLRQDLEIVSRQLYSLYGNNLKKLLYPAGNENVDTLNQESKLNNQKNFDLSLERISRIIDSDVSIYLSDGSLCKSTQLSIFHTVINSPHMNSEILKQFRKNKFSEIIVQEQIRDLSFLAGYIPLYQGTLDLNGNESVPITSELLGFINIPFLSQQDMINYQIEKVVAYLLSIYVLVFFTVLAIGLIITRAITRPIALLKDRMDKTILDGENEPIQYQTNNELGGLIESYNLMVEQLTESRRKLKEDEREKASRNMARLYAHEINNPLMPMKLKMDAIRRTLLEEHQVDPDELLSAVNATMSQIDVMSNLVRRFADIDYLSSSKNEEVNLTNLIQNVYHLNSARPNVSFRLQLPKNILWVMGDSTHLNQIFTNLIVNATQAIDYKGEIIISASVYEGNVTVMVSDNGKGISSINKARIFTLEHTTKTSGSGLGLHHSLKWIESMGGTIKFESIEGVGTSFFVTMPLLR